MWQRKAQLILIGLPLWCVLTESALAQTRLTQQPRVYVAVSGGVQETSNDFKQRTTFTGNVEQGFIDTAYPVKGGPQFDVGGGVRLWKNLEVGATLSRYSNSSSADITAQIPHPLFFAQNRQIQGSASVDRSELVAHIQATWRLRITSRVDAALMGGPSYFNVKQGIVSRVDWRDSYPYDTASFAGAATDSQSKSALGFNAGADVTVRFSRHAGVGGFARFSHASIDFFGSDNAPVEAVAGGLQTGAGLRLRF